MVDPNTIAFVKQAATDSGLDPAVVCAIVEQESNWNCYAIRYEPAFMARYVAPLYTNQKISATEAYARSFSWGPMQVMGQVARENGYEGPLPMLCDLPTGIAVGTKVWKGKLDKAAGDVTKALFLWNGGGNLAYPSQVLARVDKYR